MNSQKLHRFTWFAKGYAQWPNLSGLIGCRINVMKVNGLIESVEYCERKFQIIILEGDFNPAIYPESRMNWSRIYNILKACEDDQSAP